MEVRTRFAPSPTGYMHLGNLRSALYTFLFARHNGGKFILRIEDTDQARYVEGATDVIYRTLRDIGMDWDEGPDVGGGYGPYIQSERKDMYLPYAEQLVREGKAYYCFCTKEELDARREAAARAAKPLSTTSTVSTCPGKRSRGALLQANPMSSARMCRNPAKHRLTTSFTATSPWTARNWMT